MSKIPQRITRVSDLILLLLIQGTKACCKMKFFTKNLYIFVAVLFLLLDRINCFPVGPVTHNIFLFQNRIFHVKNFGELISVSVSNRNQT
jgi:hypothetical protein